MTCSGSDRTREASEPRAVILNAVKDLWEAFGCQTTIASGNPRRITEVPENCLLLDCILLLGLHVTRHGRAFSAIGVTKGNLTGELLCNGCNVECALVLVQGRFRITASLQDQAESRFEVIWWKRRHDEMPFFSYC